MRKPWMQFYTRDWMDCKELRRCTPEARAALVDLMCLASEGTPIGYLRDKIGPLSEAFMAERFHVPLPKLRRWIRELVVAERLHREVESGVLYVKRIVEDEVLRQKRAAGGSKSLKHPNVPKKGLPSGAKEGNPSAANKGSPCLEKDKEVLPSDSDLRSPLQGGVGEEDFADWFERQYARHPVKRDKGLAERAALAHFEREEFTLEGFERVHSAWCRTELWRWKQGAKAPTLAQWIEDEGYRYMPPDEGGTEGPEEPPGHMNPGLRM